MVKRAISNCTIIAFITALGFAKTSPLSITAHQTLLSIASHQPYNAIPEDSIDLPPPDIQQQLVTHGPRDAARIALTFDADMNPYMKRLYDSHQVSSWYNKDIIDILNKTHTPATLFLSGMWIEMYPEATRELAKDPLFDFGNHSYSHPSFDGKCYGLASLPDDQDAEEITKTQDLLTEYTGRTNTFFRFPGGCYGEKDLETVGDLGLEIVHWDVVAGDGFNPDAARIVHNVVSQTQNGSIIVMHMHGGPNAPKTAEALPEIIATLKGKGFEFVKLSALLAP